MTNYARTPPKDPFSPYSVWALLSMWWARPLLIPAAQVNSAFVSALPVSVDIQYYADCLLEAWEQETKKPTPSFYRALIQVFWKKYVWYMVPFVLMACGQLGIAVSLRFLVSGLKESSSTICYILAAVYSLLSLFSICQVNQGFIRAKVLGALMRASLSLALYEKPLTLSNLELSKCEVSAKLINLIGCATEIFDLLPSMMFLFVTPFFVMISTPILWYFVGPTGIIAEMIVVVLVPIKLYMAKCVFKLKKSTTELTESQIQLTQSLIEEIKSVKMYAREPELLAQIEDEAEGVGSLRYLLPLLVALLQVNMGAAGFTARDGVYAWTLPWHILLDILLDLSEQQ